MVYGYQYDALGRTVGIENKYLNLAMSYKFDAFGNRKSLEVKRSGNDLISFGYSYNSLDQLSEISDNMLGGDTIGFGFGSSGRMNQIRNINGSHSDFTYSTSTGQLTAINHKRSDETTILSLAYGYTVRNNIAQKTIDGIPTIYTYDLKDQLAGVQVGATTTEAYTYDGVGNRSSSLENGSTIHWNYNAGNELTSYPNHTFDYDDNGNMNYMNENGQAANLTYSVDDRLAEYSKGASLSQYYYDIYNLRVKKRVDATDTYFLYDGSVLLAELDANKTMQKYYTFIPGSYYPLAMNVISGSTINSYAYHNDHLMTPLRMTDASQTIAWSGSYKAFGEVASSGQITNNLRFPGQWAETDNSFYYNHNRSYIPELSIYSQLDPLRLGNIAFNLESSFQTLTYSHNGRNMYEKNYGKLNLYDNLRTVNLISMMSKNRNDVIRMVIMFLITMNSVPTAAYYAGNNPIQFFDPNGLISGKCIFCHIVWHLDAAAACFIACLPAEAGGPWVHVACDLICDIPLGITAGHFACKSECRPPVCPVKDWPWGPRTTDV